MSETAPEQIDLRVLLARMDRDLAEAPKLRAESEKLLAEQRKLNAEAAKLFSESRKLDRDRLLAPWLAILGVIGGLITIAGALWRALHG